MDRSERDEELTSLRNALAEAEEELEQLRDLDQWKDAFLAAAAHDVRAPVAVIVGAAETLQARPDLDPDTVQTLADRIRAQVGRLDRLLQDLFELDRFTRGQVAPERRSTDVADLVRQVIEMIDSPEHPIEVQTEDVQAELDSLRVEQIVDNLVRNAVVHTPAGTPIRVAVTGDRQLVTLVVEDEGPGIPAEVRDSLFAPFRTHAAHDDDRAGTGIGLALVRLFAELHGGTARAEDREGGGARFVVELPGG